MAFSFCWALRVRLDSTFRSDSSTHFSPPRQVTRKPGAQREVFTPLGPSCWYRRSEGSTCQRSAHKLDNFAENQLEALRAQIDRIDNYFLEIMGERMDIARKIGEFKRDNGITILQTNRWDEIIHDRVKKAAKKELTEDFVKDMMEAIHQESIRHQTKIMNNILAE